MHVAELWLTCFYILPRVDDGQNSTLLRTCMLVNAALC